MNHGFIYYGLYYGEPDTVLSCLVSITSLHIVCIWMIETKKNGKKVMWIDKWIMWTAWLDILGDGGRTGSVGNPTGIVVSHAGRGMEILWFWRPYRTGYGDGPFHPHTGRGIEVHGFGAHTGRGMGTALETDYEC